MRLLRVSKDGQIDAYSHKNRSNAHKVNGIFSESMFSNYPHDPLMSLDNFAISSPTETSISLCPLQKQTFAWRERKRGREKESENIDRI
uniref:Uncharacterized protein n=1 Tax=Glossina austeni TaxID=7395 RepID=A0A1A9VPC8_GLOAU